MTVRWLEDAPQAPVVRWLDDSEQMVHGTPMQQLGQAEESSSKSNWRTFYTVVSIAGAALSAYHGYARNNSIGWGIGWGLLGGLFPIITVPIAFAQGYGKPAR